MSERELTNCAIEHWCADEGYGLRIAWENGLPQLYLLETSKLPEGSMRDNEPLIQKGLKASSSNELCDNLPCRRMWLGLLDEAELSRFLSAAEAMHEIFSSKAEA